MLDAIKTPEELMEYLNENFEYGVLDNKRNKYTNSDTDEFQNVCNNDWKLRTVNEMLNDGVGHCYDQVEIERFWFESRGYLVKTFWVCAFQQGIDNSGFSHSYLIYKENGLWKLFEHSDYFNRGIYTFKSIKDAILWQAKNQIITATKSVKPQKEYVTCVKEFTQPPVGIDMNGYIEFVNAFEDYN